MQSIAKIDQTLARIAQINPSINAFTHVIKPKYERDSLGPLSGIPIAIKDNILVKDEPVTAASNILDGYVASEDATCVRLLRDVGGAIVVGKTNMDEFGMGSNSIHSKFGPVKNPRFGNAADGYYYSAGGSSGGSAASVASKLTPL